MAAFNVMKPFTPLSETEIDAVALQIKAQRAKNDNRYGNPIGFEFINEKKLGKSLLMLTYIEKTKKHVLPWLFYFYKTEGGWTLNEFKWKDNIKMLFDSN